MKRSEYMKKILLLTVVLLSMKISVAQGETDSLAVDQGDSAEASPFIELGNGGFTLNIGDKNVHQDEDDEDEDRDRRDDFFDFGILNGFDLGFNSFMVNGDLNLPAELGHFEQKRGNSTNVQIRLINLKFRMTRNAAFNFGLALDYNDWALENNVTLQPDQPEVTFLEEDIQFSKNKFKAKYLALPVRLNLASNGGVVISGGFEPQFLLRGRVKQRSSEHGKTKVDDNYNLREFRYAWVGRVGFEGISVFCRYYPKSIFADGKGPEIQNISFGIGLGF